jgi:hypothetical protein
MIATVLERQDSSQKSLLHFCLTLECPPLAARESGKVTILAGYFVTLRKNWASVSKEEGENRHWVGN